MARALVALFCLYIAAGLLLGMLMDGWTVLKAWLFFRPIKRLKARRARKRRLRELGIEEDFAMDTGLRTSSNSLVAGAVAYVLSLVANFVPSLAPLANDPQVVGAFVAVVMFVVARISKTPAVPGKV